MGLRVTEKCFAIWEFLKSRQKYAFTNGEIREALTKKQDLKSELRKMNAKQILGALAVLKYNRLVSKREMANGKIYWQGKGNWPEHLNKKHEGGHHT